VPHSQDPSVWLFEHEAVGLAQDKIQPTDTVKLTEGGRPQLCLPPSLLQCPLVWPTSQTPRHVLGALHYWRRTCLGAAVHRSQPNPLELEKTYNGVVRCLTFEQYKIIQSQQPNNHSHRV